MMNAHQGRAAAKGQTSSFYITSKKAVSLSSKKTTSFNAQTNRLRFIHKQSNARTVIILSRK